MLCTRRVLPMPASPSIASAGARPSLSWRTAVAARPNSASRPTSPSAEGTLEASPTPQASRTPAPESSRRQAKQASQAQAQGSRCHRPSNAWPGSGRCGEAVAGAAHRLQASGTVTELAAEGADHDLDDVAAAAPLVAPYVAQQRRPADDPAFAFVQVLKDVEFELGEIGAGAVEDELAAAGIEHGVVVDEHFPRREVG